MIVLTDSMQRPIGLNPCEDLHLLEGRPVVSVRWLLWGARMTLAAAGAGAQVRCGSFWLIEATAAGSGLLKAPEAGGKHL